MTVSERLKIKRLASGCGADPLANRQTLPGITRSRIRMNNKWENFPFVNCGRQRFQRGPGPDGGGGPGGGPSCGGGPPLSGAEKSRSGPPLPKGERSGGGRSEGPPGRRGPKPSGTRPSGKPVILLSPARRHRRSHDHQEMAASSRKARTLRVPRPAGPYRSAGRSRR